MFEYARTTETYGSESSRCAILVQLVIRRTMILVRTIPSSIGPEGKELVVNEYSIPYGGGRTGKP